jgi:hypothetical protein
MQMLLKLPTDAWANGIPNFSFDALAMLRHHLLVFGLQTPGAREVYEKVKAMMAWVFATQVGEDGRLRRGEGIAYFFNIGFIDWSPQPLGGRLEEIGPVQFAWLEALDNAVLLAGWFGDSSNRAIWSAAAGRLRPLLRQLFWQAGVGFHHTLNQVEPQGTSWTMPLAPEVHYRKSYVEGVAYGPSGPSVHSAARAVFAGLCSAEEASAHRQNLADPALPLAITGFYQYYVNYARAQAGDSQGALLALRGYFGEMADAWDSPTMWESYEPDRRDIGRLSLSAWPKSLCHGWSSGTVPIAARYLLGLDPQEPRMGKLVLAPARCVDWAFEATVPTAHGPVEIRCDGGNAKVQYRIPRTIPMVSFSPDAPVEVTRS